MNIETIIDNKNFSMWYYPEKKIVHHKFHELVCGTTLHDYLYAGVKLLKERNAHKWLSDDRLNPTLSPEDVLYGINKWTPAAVAAGWKFWAVLLPEAFIGKSSMIEYLNYNTQKGVVSKVFSDYEEAFEWLDKQ